MKSLSSATIIISYLVLSISCNHLPIDTYSNNDINDVTVSEFDLMASSNIYDYFEDYNDHSIDNIYNKNHQDIGYMSGKENRVLLEQNEFLTTERKLQHQINLNENTPIKKKQIKENSSLKKKNITSGESSSKKQDNESIDKKDDDIKINIIKMKKSKPPPGSQTALLPANLGAKVKQLYQKEVERPPGGILGRIDPKPSNLGFYKWRNPGYIIPLNIDNMMKIYKIKETDKGAGKGLKKLMYILMWAAISFITLLYYYCVFKFLNLYFTVEIQRARFNSYQMIPMKRVYKD